MDHLTATCIAARVAGMTYGKYVAMMHDRDPTQKKLCRKKKAEKNQDVESLERSCSICGCKFEANHPSKKYCSDECRKKAERMAYKRWYDKQKG